MEEYWKALLAGLTIDNEDKFSWIVLPAIIVIFVVVSLVFKS